MSGKRRHLVRVKNLVKMQIKAIILMILKLHLFIHPDVLIRLLIILILQLLLMMGLVLIVLVPGVLMKSALITVLLILVTVMEIL